MNNLNEIRENFENGRISREEYWEEMQACHNVFSQYQSLIAGTNVDSIQIYGDELRVVTSDKVSMLWNPTDLRSASNILVNYGIYEQEESPFLLAAGKDAEVIFDIGANAGYYALHWASRIASNGCIHAFEPVPSTYARLQRNVHLNGLERSVHTRNFGLGDEAKTVSIFLPEFSGSSAASIKNLHPEEKSIEVAVRIETLDEYFTGAGLSRLDLIKIDVEGAELLVLKGGRKTLARQKPILFMELLRKWSLPFGYHPNDVIALLGEIGYRGYAIDNNNLVPFYTMTDETRQTNFFFVDPDKHANWLAANRA